MDKWALPECEHYLAEHPGGLQHAYGYLARADTLSEEEKSFVTKYVYTLARQAYLLNP